ncbi:hypothetical protein QBC35DRAFT_500130 [Podospora australis]|uniref:Uncharacterized protein n=1 Tax=Podospora australis TaxID=1536484 RepID=A0AAN6WRH1_9PEZI|nr:hypothetical protein QBC35DRAFT_500130 [Podospora australis]
METQPKDAEPPTQDPANSEHSVASVPNETTPSTPPSDNNASASFPVLRFPKPQGSQDLANWISDSAPDLLQLPTTTMTTEPTNLADSAYEIITDADTDSHDGRLSESIGSLVVSQPDDVHSLDGSDNRSDAQYNTDSDEDGDSDHSSHASSIRYADQALGNPSTHPPTTQLEFGLSSEGSSIVARSIEFQEDKDDTVLLEKISVKHAIREFTEEESADLAQRLDLPTTPKHLVATVRQTMSQAYLSTQEPLRILYVGRADAQRSIVLKICSAIWASPQNGEKDADYINRHREGVYNIVPISSFGPAPELDLMEASAYQIKVEHCTSAEEVNYGVLPGDTVYSITIEHDKVYNSIDSPAGSAIQPRYSLPHIAVLYCAEKDDSEAERTRDAAWGFMNRHGVPCIFVSEQQSFAKRTNGSWDDCVVEHSVHLCLESRDPEKPMPCRRYPIDFASFSDIDARQMNRNLAYLTGLSESEDSFVAVEMASDKEIPEVELVEFMGTARQAWANFIERGGHYQLLRFLVPLFLAVISPIIIQLFTGTSVPTQSAVNQAPVVNDLGPSPICVASPLTTKSSSVVTSTTTRTVVINRTQTKTVSLVSAEPKASPFASMLSQASVLSSRQSSVPTEQEDKKTVDPPKKTSVFSARILDRSQILVHVTGKELRLPLDYLTIGVFRGTSPIKVQVSPSDKGLVVDLEPKDAHGAVNVSVVSNRRPKINETFEVIFNNHGASREVLDAAIEKLQVGLSQLKKEATSAMNTLGDALEAGKSASDRTTETLQQMVDTAKEKVSTPLKGANLALLEAQIASKLWWLKIQGKSKEHAEYQRQADEYYKLRKNELVASREKGASNMDFPGCSKQSVWKPFSKACLKGSPPKQDSDRGSWWKKIPRN